MSRNVGDLDRGIRMPAGIMAMALGLSGVVGGLAGAALVGSGAVLLATGIAGRCLIYRALGLNTVHGQA
jgi:hypothetical protein